MRSLLPAARRFLDRPLGGRRWIYLYVDGTNFRVPEPVNDYETAGVRV
jgi:hypothetical protein